MNKYKNLIWILSILILSISFVNGYCLQQQTNQSITGDGNCTLNYTGQYSSSPSYIYMNYSKPIYAINTSLWNVKYGYSGAGGNIVAEPVTPYNLNLTLPNNCFNQNPIQLRLYSYSDLTTSPQSENRAECFNGTGFQIIDSKTSGSSGDTTLQTASASIGYDANYSTHVCYFKARFGGGENWANLFSYSGNQYLTVCGRAVISEESMYWDLASCQENWVAQYNETCNGIISNNYLTYTDSNNCNTTYTLPVNNGTVQSCCVENWIQNNSVCDGYNETILYYDNSSCGTSFTLPMLNGTVFDCHCYPNWVSDSNICVNNINLVTYTDTNMCGSNESLPLNNGTYASCVTQTQNTFALTPDQLTLLILGFMIIIALICAITVHEAFFGMVALLFGLMMTTFIYYDYPMIITFASGFMILLFSVMWIVVHKAKR